jgi:hypothetical protein
MCEYHDTGSDDEEQPNNNDTDLPEGDTDGPKWRKRGDIGGKKLIDITKGGPAFRMFSLIRAYRVQSMTSDHSPSSITCKKVAIIMIQK